MLMRWQSRPGLPVCSFSVRTLPFFKKLQQALDWIGNPGNTILIAPIYYLYAIYKHSINGLEHTS